MNERQPLTFPEAIQLAASHFFDIEGRSRRSEFWWVILAMYVVAAILPVAFIVMDFLALPLVFRRLHDTGRSGWWYGALLIGQYLSGVVCFAVLGISIFSIVTMGLGGLALLPAVMVCGALVVCYRIALLFFLCQDSTPGANQYGSSTKYED